MPDNCKNCDMAAIPLIAHEMEMTKRDTKERKMFTAIVILILLLTVTNAYHIVEFLF